MERERESEREREREKERENDIFHLKSVDSVEGERARARVREWANV